MSIGAILQTCSVNVVQMIVARVITGMLLLLLQGSWTDYCTRIRQWVEQYPPFQTLSQRTLSINTATAPVWQSETSKPSWRGKLVVFSMMYVNS